MELKDQVASLDPSKRLRELGEPQGSIWYWVPRSRKAIKSGHYLIEKTYRKHYFERDSKDVYSALTVAELGERLPKHGYIILWSDSTQKWLLTHYRMDEWSFEADTEANARAKMLIHLREKGIVKVGG